MRQVDTESSDDYGEEFYQPKTRAQKNKKTEIGAGKAQVEKKESSKGKKSTASGNAPQHVPTPQVDLIDLIGPSKPSEAPAQSFAFDFMTGESQKAQQPQAQTINLLSMGAVAPAPVEIAKPTPQVDIFDLLSGPSP